MRISVVFILSLITMAGLAQDKVYRPSSKSYVINYEGFTMSFSKTHKQAEWVLYQLERPDVLGKAQIHGQLSDDSRFHSHQIHTNDFIGTPYAKGHLMPPHDARASEKSEKHAHLSTNCVPQLAGFKKGIWRQAEKQIRSWALHTNGLIVVSGAHMGNTSTSIGSGIPVADGFYKVVFDGSGIEKKMIAFYFPHTESTDQPITNFVISVDSLEQITGIDFFTGMADDVEAYYESNLDISEWTFVTITDEMPCQVVLANLGLCGEKNKNVSGVCYKHEKKGDRVIVDDTQSSKKCIASDKGTPCDKFTTDVSGLCNFHMHPAE